MNKRAVALVISFAVVAAFGLYHLSGGDHPWRNDRAATAKNAMISPDAVNALFTTTSARLNEISPSDESDNPVALVEELFEDGLSDLNESLSVNEPSEGALIPPQPTVIINGPSDSAKDQ